jgi:hypothetical protein
MSSSGSLIWTGIFVRQGDSVRESLFGGESQGCSAFPPGVENL